MSHPMAKVLGLTLLLSFIATTTAWTWNEPPSDSPPITEQPVDSEPRDDSSAVATEPADVPTAPSAPPVPPVPPAPPAPPGRPFGLRRDRQAPPALERAIADALANNPEIRIAEIKVREAEAEAARVRLEITKHVISALQEIEQARSELDHARERVREKVLAFRKTDDRATKEADEKIRRDPEVREAERRLREVEARFLPLLGRSIIGGEPVTRVYPLFSAPGPDLLELLSAALPDIERQGRWELHEPNNSLVVTAPVGLHDRLWRLLLVLRNKRFIREGLGDPPDPTRAADHGLATKKTQDALKEKVTLEFVETPVTVVLEFLKDRSGLNFLLSPSLDPKTPITVSVRDVSLAGALQAIEDVSAIQWVMREYGVLATDRPPPPPGGFGLPASRFDVAFPPPPDGDEHPLRIRLPSPRLRPRPPAAPEKELAKPQKKD